MSDRAIFDPASCHIELVTHAQAKAVVAEAHYIGRLGSTSVKLGLYQRDKLAGVICYGTIPRNNAKSICGPDYAPSVLELTRLALYDWAPPNSESWFIGQSFRWLQENRPDIGVLISYADASVGHAGTIYQATNWRYTGKSGGDVFWLCDNGTVMHPRTTGWDRAKLPPGKWMPSPGKHRYVTFIGAPARRRAAAAALRWPSLPYPKTTLTQ